MLRRSATLGCALLAFACAEAPRNVLLLSLDSVRADHTSALGYRPSHHPEVATTPAMDRLAREGVVFEQAISTTSWTLPSHVALMSGLPDALHGVVQHDQALDPALDTLAELLSRHGWATGGFVSGPYLNPVFGFGQGFDVYENAGQEVPLDVFESDDLGRWKDVHTHSHETITSPNLYARSSAWIRRTVERGEPFFAFVHWWDPHYDYKAPAEYAARFDSGYTGTWTGVRKLDIDKEDPNWTPPDADDLAHLLSLYDAEILYTDEHIGRLLDLLDELGVRDDTLVVVTSDHGEEFFENPEQRRWGHQRTLRDDVVRVPLVMRLPGELPAGVRAAGQAGLQDVLPTIADVVDLPLPGYVYGRSLRPLWEDPTRPGRDQPLLLVVPHQEIHISGLRTAELKILWDHATETGSYWNLRRDRLESGGWPFDRGALESGEHAGLAALRRWLTESEALRAALPRTPGHGKIVLDDRMRDELEAIGYLGEDPERPR
jgi:arylsulfatase A-like enzyme